MRNYGQTKFLQVPFLSTAAGCHSLALGTVARWLPGTRCGSPLPPLAGQAAWALDLQEQMGGRLDVVLHNPVRSAPPPTPHPALLSVCC